VVLARVLLDAGGQPGEVDELLRPGEPWPDTAPRHTALAYRALRQGEPATAVRHAERAVELAPDSEEAFTLLGMALARSNQPEAAVAAWREVLRIKPQDGTAHAALAALHGAIGQAEAAALHREYARRLAR
jgi:Tfp pilus assembly protein PilF